MPSFEVIVPRAVRPLIDQLAGQRAGYGEAYAQLERDSFLRETHLLTRGRRRRRNG